MPSTAFVRAEAIEKTYSRSRDAEVAAVALSGANFEIAEHESVSLLGRSGSGKSTLLNLLAGLDRPTHGRLHVGSYELSACSKTQLDQYRREMVGVVFQQFRLVAHKSAEQNVALPLMFAGVGVRERKCRVAECLELLGLSDRAKHRPAELSGGEQQRVAVARAIANTPKLLLADEPTGNLDSQNAKQVMELLQQARAASKATLVLVTHDAELAEQYTDRTLVMNDGRIEEEVDA